MAAVAEGRGLTAAAVDSIAQGRVWMGGDAIARGLCDGFGTLDQAIAQARLAAGIPAWRDVQLVEYPPRPLIELPLAAAAAALAVRAGRPGQRVAGGRLRG